ncbi:MAG: aminoglycoside phosphotransferase family protein [Pseudomonadota bacterium]
MSEPRIDAELVRSLIAAQFPHWADLPIRPVATSGWDNRTFHLGDSMSVRLPSAARYAAQAAKEQCWLPHLAAYLPLAIPEPLGAGEPSQHYPFHWTIMRWLPGQTVASATPKTQQSIAADLAHFLNALRRVPSVGGPAAGPHNFYRGGDLRIYHQEVHHCLGQLDAKVDASAILRVWDRACRSAWSGAPVWLHGDVSPDNLLMQNGKLSGVIDFGNCAIGDPACDLSIAWTLFEAPARMVFFQLVDLDAACWERAAGWTLWKTLLQLCRGQAAAERVITNVLREAEQERIS